MWFEKLTGFKEQSPEEVRKNLTVDGINLISGVNGRSFQHGSLEILTLLELKDRAPGVDTFNGKITVSEIVGDVQEIHCNPENYNALFQAASQFNLLEMVAPNVTPEQGVDRYERDFTQGPACAIACGAGTIYRNYFVPVDGHVGQTSVKQIDCLDLIGEELKNDELHLWEMRNALLNQEGLLRINSILSQLTDIERETLKSTLKIGLQWNTQVTLSEKYQIVSQAYCSALPVAYTQIESAYFESFARIILEATYEATLYAALINHEKTGSNKVYLTLVGGGAFGNETYWITESVYKILNKFKNTPLDIKIVSFRNSGRNVRKLVEDINKVIALL